MQSLPEIRGLTDVWLGRLICAPQSKHRRRRSKLGKEVPGMISGERNGIRQQFVSHQTTGYIDLFSLAHPRVAAHQECKLLRDVSFMFSRIEFLQLRKTCTRYMAVFTGLIHMMVLISTASSGALCLQCGFSWKAQAVLSLPSFFSHRYQISGALLHSLCTINRLYPSLFARYPKLPQPSVTTTVFI